MALVRSIGCGAGGQAGGGGGGGGVAGAPKTKIRVLVPKTLLRLYLTLPVTSATSERTRTFSTLRRLKNYLRITLKQDSLDKLEQLPTDALSQIDYGHTRHCEDGKTFACAN